MLSPRCLSLKNFACGALLLGAASGCFYESSATPMDNDGGGSRVQEATIDTGATLSTEPGLGAGVFIEYLGDGNWHVFTSCDTETSGYSCLWDVYLNLPEGVALGDIEGVNLEVGDDVYSAYEDELHLQVETAYGFDEVYFKTTPGEPVRLEAYLDNVREPRFIYWVGDGAIHDGAPSNPIDFIPSVP